MLFKKRIVDEALEKEIKAQLQNNKKEETMIKLSIPQLIAATTVMVIIGFVISMLVAPTMVQAQLKLTQVTTPIPPSWEELTFQKVVTQSCINKDAFEMLRVGGVGKYNTVPSYDVVCGPKPPVPTDKGQNTSDLLTGGTVKKGKHQPL
jgi:hypothetical protein